MRFRRITYSFVVSCIALTPYVEGCGGSTDMTTPTGPRTIQGTSRDTFVTEQNEMESPSDLTNYTISASVMDGTNFTEIMGTGQTDGSFSIPNVPQGSYWLKFINPDKSTIPIYFYTSAATVDMSRRRIERTGLVFATAPTLLSMTLTNLMAWDPRCFLEAQVPSQSSRWLVSSPPVSSGNDGATQLTVDVTVQGNTQYSPALLDPALGDKLTILQICPSAADATNLTVQRYGTVMPPKMIDGQVAAVNIAMVDVPQTQTLKAHFRRSSFAALATGISPEVMTSDLLSTVYAIPSPGSGTSASEDEFGELVTYRPTGLTDIDLNLAYGNPNPLTWFLEIPFLMSVDVMRAIPGQVTPAFITTRIRSAYSAASGTMATPIDGGPIVGSVQMPQVGGHDAFVAQTGVSLTPTLSWSAPQQGTADLYAVKVFTAGSLATIWKESAVLYTSTPSITIPPGVLSSGQAYVFYIEAQNRGSADLSTAPLRAGYPNGVAPSLSAVMQTN